MHRSAADKECMSRTSRMLPPENYAKIWWLLMEVDHVLEGISVEPCSPDS